MDVLPADRLFPLDWLVLVDRLLEDCVESERFLPDELERLVDRPDDRLLDALLLVECFLVLLPVPRWDELLSERTEPALSTVVSEADSDVLSSPASGNTVSGGRSSSRLSTYSR